MSLPTAGAELLNSNSSFLASYLPLYAYQTPDVWASRQQRHYRHSVRCYDSRPHSVDVHVSLHVHQRSLTIDAGAFRQLYYYRHSMRCYDICSHSIDVHVPLHIYLRYHTLNESIWGHQCYQNPVVIVTTSATQRNTCHLTIVIDIRVN